MEVIFLFRAIPGTWLEKASPQTLELMQQTEMTFRILAQAQKLFGLPPIGVLYMGV